MEATGSYSFDIADFLYVNDYNVYVVNPMCIKAFSKITLSRCKTDESDAVLIIYSKNACYTL